MTITIPSREVLARISGGNQQMIKWLEDVSARMNALTGSGLPIARMTTAERDALVDPEDGVIVYDTTTETFQGRAGGAWVDLH
jgi:hypothetical protein